MEVKYYIMDIECKMYLKQLTIESTDYASMNANYIWKTNKFEAIRFSTYEEAEATIKLIIDVIDSELEDKLEIMEEI